MRHRRRTKYFGVKTAHRKAMFRNMATSLFRHGRITTTVTRAKELRRVADRLVSLAKEGSLHSRRQALSYLMDKGVVARLFSEIAPLMAERRGGYTRIVRIGPRRGDGAMMCIIELVTESLKPSKPSKKKQETERDQVAPTVIPAAAPVGQEAEESQEESGEGQTAEAEEAVSEEQVQVEKEDTETDEEASDESDEAHDEAPDQTAAEAATGAETTDAEAKAEVVDSEEDGQEKESDSQKNE